MPGRSSTTPRQRTAPLPPRPTALRRARCTQEGFTAAASTAEDFEAEVHSLKCAIKDLEADKASLIADKAALEAKISILEGCLLAAAEEKEEVRALQAKAEELEMKVRDLTEELRLSKEQAKEAVEEQVRIGTAREEELEQVIKALEDIRTRLEEGAHWIQYRQESWRE